MHEYIRIFQRVVVVKRTMASVNPDEWVVIIDSENDNVTSPSTGSSSDSSSDSSSGQEAEALAHAILQASDTDAILLKSSEYSQHSQHSQHSQYAPDTHTLNKSILSSSSLVIKAQTVLLCLIITHCVGSVVYLRYLYKRRTPQTP